MFFKKKESNKLLQKSNGNRYWLLFSPLQMACIVAVLWAFVIMLIFPAYRHACISMQAMALYMLILDGISKSLDDNKK